MNFCISANNSLIALDALRRRRRKESQKKTASTPNPIHRYLRHRRHRHHFELSRRQKRFPGKDREQSFRHALTRAALSLLLRRTAAASPPPPPLRSSGICPRSVKILFVFLSCSRGPRFSSKPCSSVAGGSSPRVSQSPACSLEVGNLFLYPRFPPPNRPRALPRSSPLKP